MKKLLHLVGAIVFVVATVLLLVQAWRYRATLAQALSDSGVLAAVLGGALAYAALLSALALAWSLAARGAMGDGWRRDLHLYALSNIYKYLPGNIFHLVSRQALFADTGLGQGVIARASLVEICLHVATVAGVAALILSAAMLTATQAGANEIVLWNLQLGLGVIAATLAGAAVLVGAVTGLRLQRGGLGRLVLLQGAFFLGYAAIVAWLFAALAPMPTDRLLRLVGGYLVAWLAGFLTPGAPGGIGVREVVFMAFAHDTPDFAVEAAVAGRLVTTLGDLLLPVVTALAGARRGEW